GHVFRNDRCRIRAPATSPTLYSQSFLCRSRKSYFFATKRLCYALHHFFAAARTNMYCRGVRGATTVDSDSRDEILASTRQLLALMIRLNGIEPQDVGSAIFTTTEDINAEFPALAARQLGWLEVPLLCTHELDVPGSLPRCIRVLVNWNTNKT